MKNILWLRAVAICVALLVPMSTHCSAQWDFDPQLIQQARTYLRAAFKGAIDSPDEVDKLFSYIHSHFGDYPEDYPAVIEVYYGALNGLKAKHAFSPFKKLHYLKASLEYLDEAVARGAGDLEVHFVRFSSLHYLPSVFGIPKKRKEDLGIIYQLLTKEDIGYIPKKDQVDFIDFLMASKRLNSIQKQKLSFAKRRLQKSEEGEIQE